ncbi:MAG: S8 family serine peptidase [Bdellovibrionales bacterium]|nr:S8 family serine peptidase [Bdellovibrionales bacterium]
MLFLLVSALGCSGVGAPVESSNVGSQSFKQIGCDLPEPAASAKLAPGVTSLKVPKVHFNTISSGLGVSVSGKLAAQSASAGERFYLALEKDCIEQQWLQSESLSRYGELSLVDSSDGAKYLFGELVLNGPYLYSDLMNSWEKLTCLRTIETAKTFSKANLPSDPLFTNQDYLEQINFNTSYRLWEPVMRGLAREVVVAVIDSGVDLDHQDLTENIWVNAGEVAGDGIDNDGNGLVDDLNGYNFVNENGDPDPDGADPFDNYHGTAVAGLIAAEVNGTGVVGVSPINTRVMSLNVFADRNSATPDHIAAAIVYATREGAKVINMSLTGAADSSVLLLAIENAIANGVTVVSAAGNFGAQIASEVDFTPGSYHASQEGAINVGALNTQDNSLALFSNRSSDFVEIAAPGSFAYSLELRRGILTLQVGDRYTESSGTSFAAPLVAGAAALVYGLYEDKYQRAPTPAEVEALIKDSGTPYRHLSGKIEGCKTLNVLNLVNSI